MSIAKTVAICQFVGELLPNSDGSMSYSGGTSHAIPVDRNMTFRDFKSAIVGNLISDAKAICIMYFLPLDNKSLVTISNDVGLQQMLGCYADSLTIDVYILPGETATPNLLKRAAHRSKSSSKSMTTTATASRAPTETPIVATESDFGNVGQSRSMATFDNVEKPGIDAAAGDNREAMLTVIMGEDGQLKMKNSRKNVMFGVGREFKNAKDIRYSVRSYAAKKGFSLHFIRNECHRVTVKCKAEGCPWRIHASRSGSMKNFRIKRMIDMHTCGVGKGGHPQETKHLMASTVQDNIQDNVEYVTREIADDISHDDAINLKHIKVWHREEVAVKKPHALQTVAYNQLSWFCDRIKQTNPGTIITLATSDDSRLDRLFVSFHASQRGFENGCRPLIFLDGIYLKDKYQGTLLVASSVDGNDGIFPIAFAIVDSETCDNWNWFLVELKSIVSRTRTITFVSDRNKGLEVAVPHLFQNSYHGFSLDHLIEDFKRVLKGFWPQHVKDSIVEEFKHAAYACTVADFNNCINNISNVSHDVASWVLASKPVRWSNAFFRGLRYGYFSSNFGDFFNSWISEECDLSAMQMLDMIRCRMTEMMYRRMESSSMWLTTYTPYTEEMLQMHISNSRELIVASLSSTVFQVRSGSVNTVNIEAWECTCQQWQIAGLPCVHAVAVLNHTGRDIYDYLSEYFTANSYHSTYSELINPTINIEKPAHVDYNPVESSIILASVGSLFCEAEQRREHCCRICGAQRPLFCMCGVAGNEKAACRV